MTLDGALPVQGEGRFGETPTVAHRPGLAVDRQALGALADPRAAEIGAVDVQLADGDLLLGKVGLNGRRRGCLGDVGGRHGDGAHQPVVQVAQDVALVAIHPDAAALAPVAHRGVRDRDTPLPGPPVAQCQRRIARGVGHAVKAAQEPTKPVPVPAPSF